MVTKKMFITTTVPLLQKNAKSVLGGHKLPSAILAMIQTRPDVCAKLLVFGYSTLNWKKGDKSLKKNDQFKISGYKNYVDFSKNSTLDIAKFQGTLPPKDQKSFQANENVITLLIVPDVSTENVDSDIINLKSSVLTYGKSLDKSYSSLGGIFITIAFGTSYFLPKDVARAETKESVNKKINIRKTPAKIKQELADKNKAKLAKLKLEGASIKSEKDKVSAELQELQGLGKEFGGDVKTFDAKVKGEIKDTLSNLTPKQRKMYSDIAKYRADGKDAIADAIEEDFNNSVDTSAKLLTEKPLSSSDVLSERKNTYKSSIEKLELANVDLTEKIATAPNARVKSSLNFTFRQNLAKINSLKSKIDVHGSVNKLSDAISKKRALLAKINDKMNANVMAGMEIREALNKAVATSNVDEVTKNEIKSDLKAEVENGMTPEEAIMQVIAVTDEEFIAQQVAQQAIESNEDFSTRTGVASTDDMATRLKVNDGYAFNGRTVFGVDTDIAEGDVYEYFSTVFNMNSLNTTTEYFVTEANADAFATEMNATLDVVVAPQVETETFEVEDGFVSIGDDVFGVFVDFDGGSIDGFKYYKYEKITYEGRQSNSTNLYYVSEENAKEKVINLNQTLDKAGKEKGLEKSFEVNDGSVMDGDSVFGVDTDIVEGDTYEYFATVFNSNSLNTTTEYFVEEANADAFATEMNATLIAPQVAPQTTLDDDINSILSFL